MMVISDLVDQFEFFIYPHSLSKILCIAVPITKVVTLGVWVRWDLYFRKSIGGTPTFLVNYEKGECMDWNLTTNKQIINFLFIYVLKIKA